MNFNKLNGSVLTSTMPNFIAKIWHFFLRLLLTTAHLVYYLYKYLDFLWIAMKNKSVDFLQSQGCDTKELVSEAARKLEKCPNHFVILLGEEGIRVEDFLNLVTWCVAANISFISFYDYTGNIKSNENIYHKYLFDKRKIDPEYLVTNVEKHKPKNGSLDQTQINFISPDDGKPLLVQTAKILSEKIVSQNLKETEINESSINEELNKLLRIPEPDLGIICGSILSTFAFLPWHIRITEFLQVKSLKSIHVSEFITLLKKYSSCTQRFGK